MNNSKHSPTIAIIQARMSSSRLPGKVLLDIAGKPMLAHVVDRAQRSQMVNEVVVATTTDPADDPVAAMCTQRGYHLYRGSLHDVLDRYHGAAHTFGAGVIVRLTADCPLIDPMVIDQTILAFRGENHNLEKSPNSIPFDFACTRLPPPWHRTFPIGLDVEVCSIAALERAWRESTEPYHREHVMPYFYEECRSIHYTITIGENLSLLPKEISKPPGNYAEPFYVLVINHDPDEGMHRWTVDTPEDLEFVRQVYAHFPGETFFGWKDVLALVKKEPQLERVNTTTIAKDYRDVDRQYH